VLEAEAPSMQSVIYIIAIGSIGTFLLWTVHKYERNHHAALLLKLAIVGVGFAAIFQPLVSLLR